MNTYLLNKLLNKVTGLILIATLSSANAYAQAPKAQWMSGGWGIGFRFKADDKADIDSWDADILADQIAQMPGVSYVIFNLSDAAHGDAYIAPHSVLSVLTPSATPTSPDADPMNGRDLFMDMALAFKARGIKVIAYCATQGPAMLKHGAEKAFDALENSDGTYTSVAMDNWAAYVTQEYGDTTDDSYKKAYAEVIINEYAKRYTTLIDGWWFDHAGLGNIPLLHQTVKTYNPDAVCTFNDGQKIPLINNNPGYEDYTFGHPNPIAQTPSNSDVNLPMLTSIEDTAEGYFEADGKWSLGHMFIPIQEKWNAGALVWTQEQGSDWMGRCLKAGGAWTWNVDLTDNQSILRADTVVLMNAVFDGILTSNGTPYSWLDQYGLVTNNDYEAADLQDFDSDGQPNHEEFTAGTDPTVPDVSSTAKSQFRISSIIQDKGTLVIKWNSESNRLYSILKSSSLKEGEWVVESSDIQGLETSTSYTYTAQKSDSKMFFKVKAEAIE